MRKLLKLMFSQLVIVSLLIILQLGIISAFVVRLSEYFIYFDLFLKLVSLVVVIIIMNRHQNPMYKLAWVIPIIMFPLLGGLFYLVMMGQTHTKMFFRKLKLIEKLSTENFPQDENVVRELEEKYPERKSTVKYINDATGLCLYKSSGAKYYTCGEEKWKDMLIDLKNAKQYIFLEYFIVKPGKMWDSVLEILKEKVKEGVEVRLMYDGMGSLTSFPMKYPKELESFGIKCCVFSPFTPFLSVLQNNRDHRKILVIDGTIAYTGGINIADEYVNIDYPHGHWKDMAVKVTGEPAFSFARIFLQLWHVQTKTPFRLKEFIPQAYDTDPHYEGYVMPYHDIPQDNYQTGEFIYLDMINKAQKYVYITSPYLILDHEMVVALINGARGGIDIKIICPTVADHWYARAVAYSYYKELTEAGVKVYEYLPGFIHGKTFCSDDKICTVGSINLDYRSLYLHFECGAWFADSPVVSSVKADFLETLKKCRLITIEDCNNISPFRKVLNAVLRIFAPLM